MSNEQDNKPFSVGNIVPYKNSRGKIVSAKITALEDTRNGVWFHGIDTATQAKVWYSCRRSLQLIQDQDNKPERTAMEF